MNLATATKEIEELHDAFARWMGVGDDAVFARFEAAFAPGFSMVGPSGARLDRAGVLDMLRARRAAFGPEFRIEIRDPVPLAAGPGFIAVGYDEVQFNRPGPLSRRASAVFEPHAGGPNGLRWLLVHETWIA
ncbi:MAG: DUF4440 domain-containing protein [Tagaea sp.]|nr:DUF4440 domain-containing protein [Tagaea sp.]